MGWSGYRRGMTLYAWLYLVAAVLLIVAVPTGLLLLWRISAQLDVLVEQRERDRESV